MPLHLPHLTLHRPINRVAVPRTPDRIPTTEDLARLFVMAQGDLQVIDAMHALAVKRYEVQRLGVINRMGDLIGANERYYGTDLRKFID